MCKNNVWQNQHARVSSWVNIDSCVQCAVAPPPPRPSPAPRSADLAVLPHNTLCGPAYSRLTTHRPQLVLNETTWNLMTIIVCQDPKNDLYHEN